MATLVPDDVDLQNLLLDYIAKKHDCKSDYALAKFLDVPLQTVRNYRKNRTQMDATMCVQISELVDCDPLQLIARTHINRTPSSRVMKVWSKYLGRLYLGAACLALATLPFEVSFAQNWSPTVDHNIHYAQRFAQIPRLATRLVAHFRAFRQRSLISFRGRQGSSRWSILGLSSS